MWCVQYEPDRHLLTLRLTQAVSLAQMRALVRAHGQALGATGGERFRVLSDLRGLTPLEPDAATVFAEIGRTTAQAVGFAGRVVLASSATVLMQQRRMSEVRASDLFTTEEGAALEYLARPL